jgi:hypothetical protein
MNDLAEIQIHLARGLKLGRNSRRRRNGPPHLKRRLIHTAPDAPMIPLEDQIESVQLKLRSRRGERARLRGDRRGRGPRAGAAAGAAREQALTTSCLRNFASTSPSSNCNSSATASDGRPR